MSNIRSFVGLHISEMAVCLGLASLVALSGCFRIQVKLKLRVSLAKLPVASMEVSQYKHPGIGPGEKSSLVATFTQPDGTELVTAGKGKGKIPWQELTVSPSVVTVNKKGVLTLDRDPRVSDGKTGHVVITVPGHPDLHAEFDIPLRYNYPFASNYAGSNGTNGLDGMDGRDGSSGGAGSMDPDNPSAGGNGGDGTSGADGGNGGDGGGGPPVQVQVALQSGSHPLLQLGVTVAGHKERFYLVDPQGGSLTVTSAGGAGGRAGKGGRAGIGGPGGTGGMGLPNGSRGIDGSSGSDGHAGSDGRGGNITVTYDPQVKPYLSAIHLSNPGGPAPVFKEAAVAPLW
jgi:hypothetical protein